MISKTFLIACAAALLSAAPSICSADDAVSTNAPAATEMKTNDTASAQSAPVTKAEAKKKKAVKKKKAEATQASKTPAGTNAPAMKPAKNAPALGPITGPASPLSADKQKRLAEILAQYRADKITPQEYHAERAKIIAEP